MLERVKSSIPLESIRGSSNSLHRAGQINATVMEKMLPNRLLYLTFVYQLIIFKRIC